MSASLFPRITRARAVRVSSLALVIIPSIINAQSNPGVEAESPELSVQPATTVWVDQIGNGFRSDAQSVGFRLGGLHGLAKCGSKEAHHMALTSVSYSFMLGPAQGENRWYHGNWEFQLELFGGAQFDPDTQWIVGLTPHFRYNFATGTRWVPFFDLGAGITGTGIGTPDLGSRFQFNEQVGIGVHCFVTRSIALTVETSYIHISNAGIQDPNCGLNGVKGMLGLTFFF